MAIRKIKRPIKHDESDIKRLSEISKTDKSLNESYIGTGTISKQDTQVNKEVKQVSILTINQ